MWWYRLLFQNLRDSGWPICVILRLAWSTDGVSGQASKLYIENMSQQSHNNKNTNQYNTTPEISKRNINQIQANGYKIIKKEYRN